MQRTLIGTAAITLAMTTALVLVPVGSDPLRAFGIGGAAWADDDGDGGGPENSRGQQNQGGQGQGSQGAQAGQDNQGGQGAGQGGPDPDSDSKGPHAGGPADTGAGGGRPVWAQEGIPEIELGRLSVVRAPSPVLDRAEAEALAMLTPEMADFYNQSLSDIVYDFAENWDTLSIYDSPLQNLALFRDVLEDGETSLAGVDDSDDGKLLAVFLGVASDKNVEITDQTVEAMVTILSKDLDTMINVNVEEVAEDAELVRVAVLTGHG